MRPLCILTLIASFIFGRISLSAEEVVDVHQVLERCLASQAVLDLSVMSIKTDIDLEYPDDRPKKQQTEVYRLRDGDRMDMRGEYKFLDKEQDSSYKFQMVVNKDYYAEFQNDRRWDGKPSGIASIKQKGSQLSLFLETSSYGGPLDGYTTNLGGKRIIKQMIDSRNLKHRPAETVNDAKCEVIESHTMFGTITVWIAPQLDFCCMKFQIVRSGSDIWTDNKSISALPPYTTSSNRGDQKPISKVVSSLDNVHTTTVEGRVIPISGRFTESVFRQGGSTVISVFDYSRQGIRLSNENIDKNSYKIDLPTGTPITFLDNESSGVHYKWSGDQVVTAFDEIQTRPVSFLPGRSARSILLMLNGSAVVAFVTWLLIRSRRKAGSNPTGTK